MRELNSLMRRSARDRMNGNVKGGISMLYKVLIAPVAPSVDDRPDFSGVLGDYDIEAGSETEAEDLEFSRFCQEKPYRSLNREDYIVNARR